MSIPNGPSKKPNDSQPNSLSLSLPLPLSSLTPPLSISPLYQELHAENESTQSRPSLRYTSYAPRAQRTALVWQL